MSVARFIADQRTFYRVPHAFCCRLLGKSEAWFYKWIHRRPTRRERRRAEVDAAVKAAFEDARGLHGSPRLHDDLVEAGWKVSEKTVADSMRRQGLVARKIKHRRGLTRQDKTAAKFPDLLKRNFAAETANLKWCGDITEIPTGPADRGPKLYLATVIDLYSRRLLAAATSLHPDAQLACEAIKMAAAVRGGREAIEGVTFHTDRGSTYTANDFTQLCKDKLGIRQSMGRVGSCFDNAAAEAFFSTLEWEVLSRHEFTDTTQAAAVVLEWCYDFYNPRRRHSSAGRMSPINYENANLQPEAA